VGPSRAERVDHTESRKDLRNIRWLSHGEMRDRRRRNTRLARDRSRNSTLILMLIKNPREAAGDVFTKHVQVPRQSRKIGFASAECCCWPLGTVRAGKLSGSSVPLVQPSRHAVRSFEDLHTFRDHKPSRPCVQTCLEVGRVKHVMPSDARSLTTEAVH
jgi:hypothetical protein